MNKTTARALTIFVGLAAFFCSFAQVKISGATISAQSDTVIVHVNGEGISKPKAISGMDKYVIYEFAGELQSKSKTFTVNKAGVSSVKIVAFSMRPHRTRVAIGTTASVSASVEEDVTGWNIIISKKKVAPNTLAADMKEMISAIQELATSPGREPKESAQTHEPKGSDAKPADAVTIMAKASDKKDVKDTQESKPAADPRDKAEMKKAIDQLSAESTAATKASNPNVKNDVVASPSNSKKPIVETQAIIIAPAAVAGIASGVAQNTKTETTGTKSNILSNDGNSQAKTGKDPFAGMPPLNMKAGAGPGLTVGKVDLNFSDTDVIAVLKALSLQTNVNIIISPGVTGATPEAEPKGNSILPDTNAGGAPQVGNGNSGTDSGKAKPRRITLSLKNVTVEEALDLVTALSGLRYARIGSSYIVTTKEEYGETVRALADRAIGSNDVRVLPILSGQSAQIKDALYRWFGKGTIEVYLPSEAGSVMPTSTSTTGADGSKTSQTTLSKVPPSSDPYIVLIGSTKWVDQAESLARRLDLDIIQTQKLKEQIDRQRARERAEMDRAGDGGPVGRQIYEVQNGKADDLKKAISETFVDVHVMASPGTSQKQVMILEGPLDQVAAAMDSLAQLDTGTVYGNEVQIYSVKFADPRSLREELITQVPGLRCSLAPSAAATPTLYKPGASTAQGAQTTGGESGQGAGTQQAGGSGAQATGTSTEVGPRGDKAEVIGLAQPFADMEKAAVPMRLILRGTQQQIDSAIAYLAQIDVAPKQLALELRVMELSKEDALNAGIDWNLLTGGAVKLIRLNNSQSDPSNSGTVHIRGAGDVTASLDAIANKNNLIARPNLLAVDGRETEIFVGDVIRYVESITSSQNGPTVTAKEIRVGVRLAVLPRIGDSGNITMDMRPVVSFLRGFLQPVEGVNLPQTSERVVQSTVNVKSGETIAIGGLIQDEDRKQASGIPILMDLPIVGHFFKKTTNQRIKTEIVFFLTVRSLDGPATGDTVPLPPKKEGGLKDGGK